MSMAAALRGLAVAIVLGALGPAIAAAQFRVKLDTLGRWTHYGADAGGTRYSPLSQVNRGNVGQLKVAWLRRTGDISDGIESPHPTSWEATPILVDSLLVVNTPKGRVVAFNAETGRYQWHHDIKVDEEVPYASYTTRGVAAWRDTVALRPGQCSRRIFVAPVDGRLVALDADSGKACKGFGKDGQLDLREGLRAKPRTRAEYGTASPPAVVGDLVIVGSVVAPNQRADAPNGVVRAFDARSGALRWQWDPIPLAAGAPGGANAWAPFSVDSARGLVFVPTGGPTPRHFGGQRLGDNRAANSVVALRAANGEVAWTFQVVRHDLWGYDVPAQPVLFTLRRDGTATPAVAVPTMQGHLFILHRETGEPLFPVEERAVPASDVPGEAAAPRQRFPVLPQPLTGSAPAPDSAFGLSDAARTACRERLAGLRSEGPFTPPSERGTLAYPGMLGGMNWAGIAIDTARGILIAPTSRVASIVRLVPRKDYERLRRAGGPGEYAPMEGTPYGVHTQLFLGPDRVPCTPPPWGALVAIDLATGAVKWERPVGFLPMLAANPKAPSWGSPIVGGPLVTAGGVVFLAGTYDSKLRGFDVETGEQLFQANIPAGGVAAPMTYRVTPSGKQYVVIAAGGHGRLGIATGDYLLAFALP